MSMRTFLLLVVIGFVLLVAGLGLAVVSFVALPFIMESLAGPPQGVTLIYEVDPESAPGNQPVDMDRLLRAVDRRVNPGFKKTARLRALDPRRIEIVLLPQDPEVARRVERMLQRAGTLEFRIAANGHDHQSLIERALKEPSKKQVFDSGGELLGWWVPVQIGQEKAFMGDPDIATRTVKPGGQNRLEVLVVKDNQDVTGQYLTRAERDTDPNSGRPCVSFAFNSTGAQLFAKLTGDNLPDPLLHMPRKLGIILDNELYSAPNIQSAISDRGIITGSFSQQDVNDQVNILNAGEMPAKLRLVEKREPASTAVENK